MYKYMIILPLIKESALLFQYQRQKATINNNKYLIATWQDLSNTLTYGGQILQAILTGMDTRLLETLPTIQKILNKQDYITVKDLMKEIHKSQSYCQKILKFFHDQGYLQTDADTKAELGIKGKTNVYIRTGEKISQIKFCNTKKINWQEVTQLETQLTQELIPTITHYQTATITYTPIPLHIYTGDGS